jgi:peroxiredoxin
MEAYRDQYATLFNNGRKVNVIAISVDSDTALANWAREGSFPVVFASDPDGAVGTLYGAYDAARKTDNRSLYVIGPDRVQGPAVQADGAGRLRGTRSGYR